MRSRYLLPAALLLFFVAFMSTAHPAAHPPVQPRNIASTKNHRRAVATGAHLTYNGGPLLQNVEVTTIFWGPKWATDANEAQLNSFLGFAVGSSMIDQLSEYNTNGMTIGHGRFIGSFADTSTPPSTIDDTQLQTYLQGLIQSGKVTASNANSLYFIFTQAGVTVTLQGQTSCQAFCGYHSNVGANGPFYAIIPYPNCTGCQLGGTTLESMTIVTSHEFTEAVTDPIPGSGWYDQTNGEIGDICEGTSKVLTH